MRRSMRSTRHVVMAMTMLGSVAVVGGISSTPANAKPAAPAVVVPGEDRFAPFALTVHVGQTVRWINRDTDSHTVVSDDAFSSAGHRGVDLPLVGTDNNAGVPGVVELRFAHPGTFVYYCRLHAHLDGSNQPAAPGPLGGIKDSNGNYGTPMTGVVTVVDD